MSQADPRYHKRKWKHTAKRTKQLTRNRCCMCGAKAVEVHHAFYGFRLLLTLPIAGFEIPGWQLFPLCDRCHSNSKGCAHHVGNYCVSKFSSWLNCNRYGYLWRLRIGFLLTVLIVHPLTAALSIGGLWLFASTISVSESLQPLLSRQFQHWQSERIAPKLQRSRMPQN
ncbi:MAG: hypothetical protein KME13_24250 [Myxacorys californica WJT36-NPBG1]|nr:hypothetical protein [Myxacorys californica WJT36-NPBG1]